MTTIPEDKLEGIISKGKELEKQLGQENTSEKFVELSKEYSDWDNYGSQLIDRL